MRFRRVVAAVAVAGVALTVVPTLSAGGNRPRVIDGVRWHESVESARKDASKTRAGKPIAWVRMLGEMSGAT
jgi:hypothetical protein